MNLRTLTVVALATCSISLAQSPGSYTYYGAGCAGTAGTPASFSTGLPVGGELITFGVDNGPSGGIALLILGGSDEFQAGLPLPLDLGVIGAPGCSLLASADVVNLASLDSAGSGSYPFVFPSGFIGFEFFTQWAVLDPAANAFGFVFSDAGAGVMGDAIYGVNLISNPGAEEDAGVPAGQDMDISRWRDDSGFVTSQLYNGFSVDDPSVGGVYPGAAFGNNYFYGGESWLSSTTYSIYQEIALHNISGDIDISKAQFDVSGWFGGWSTQDDTMTLYANFTDGQGTVLGSVQLGGLAISGSAARGGNAGLIFDTAQGVLPVGTRYVLLQLEAFKIPAGSYCDAAADNLEFVLTLLP